MDVKILVYEEYHTLAHVAGFCLKGLGVTYDIAENIQAAKDLLSKNKYDIIFVDVNYPVGSLEAFMLESGLNNINDVPVIGLTVHPEEFWHEHCAKAGIKELVFKPLDAQKATHLIQKHVTKPA